MLELELVERLLVLVVRRRQLGLLLALLGEERRLGVVALLDIALRSPDHLPSEGQPEGGSSDDLERRLALSQ